MPEMRKIHSFDEVFDAQQVFRRILTAMANPTRRVDIRPFAGKLYGGNPAFLAVAMTLLDNEVSFSAGADHTLAEQIVSLTLARSAGAGEADYLFVSDLRELGDAVRSAKCGTLCDPHQSATLVVRDDGENTCRLRLCGPGIDGTTEFSATPLVETALELRDGQCYEYPQGIDFIFVSGDGGLFAIPRLTLRETPAK